MFSVAVVTRLGQEVFLRNKSRLRGYVTAEVTIAVVILLSVLGFAATVVALVTSAHEDAPTRPQDRAPLTTQPGT